MKILIALLLSLAPMTASAYFQMDMMKAKVTERQASQWTLADWLTQKNKVSLLDSWLAMNRRTNFFDLSLSAAKAKGELKSEAGGVSTTIDQDSELYTADMYLSFFNLYGEFEHSKDDTATKESYGGAAGFRLLGASTQTTNLVVRYGWRRLRNLTSQEDWENQYAEGNLQLYIIRYFGITGSYRYYFPNESDRGNKLEGTRASVGAFIEALIFRIQANAYQEPLEHTSNGVVTKEERSGLDVGVKMHF